MFPSLKESDDEKISKALVKYFTSSIENSDYEICGIPFKKVLYWLEKQGEKGAKGNEGEIPNPAWSEVDEKMLEDTCRILSNSKECTTSNVRWLKSLKDRVQPRPEQEWSKEDKKMISMVITDLNLAHDVVRKGVAKKELKKEIEWLKSLRPQPKQGLSEDEEGIIATALSNTYSDGIATKLLNKIKSIRPQPKQEWTKEDAERFESCLKRLGTGNPEQPESVNSKWFREHVSPQKQCGNDVPSKEYILNVWELGNHWKAITKGVCNTEYGGQLEYIQKHWKEGEYYKKLVPQKQWKPSDEQIRALANALSLAKNCGEESSFDLRTLYEQLKKLREE